MAFNQARSSQIKLNSITNEHIKVGTKIDESKLNIDWQARTAEIFSSKLLIDYVQVEGKTVSADSSSVIVTAQISADPADSDDKKGAIVQSGKNKVILRNAVTGEPIISPHGTEVYGKLTHNGTDYTVNFYAKDGSGVEQTYTFTETTTIDFQFPQRFDFNTVSEMFAANEKFVDGAADVSARLDLEQIVKDTFGTSYSLHQNGEGTRSQSIAEELVEATSGAVNTNVRASVIIDEVVDARGVYSDLKTRLGTIESNVVNNANSIASLLLEITNARGDSDSLVDELTRLAGLVDVHKGELASTEAGKGASLIGIEDVEDVFTSDNVEGALKELEGRLQVVEQTGGSEVLDARDSSITGSHESLDARLEAAETRYETVKDEVEEARGSSESIHARLINIETELQNEAQNRANADLAITNDLASTLEGKGASLIGVHDADGKLESANVEDALIEIYDVAKAVKDEVEAARGEVETLDARLDEIESDISDVGNRVTDLESEKHSHFAYDKQVLSGDPVIGTNQINLPDGMTFVAGNKSLQVYVNGFLQMVGVHYMEIEVSGPGTGGTGIIFADELIEEGDIIQLRWHK